MNREFITVYLVKTQPPATIELHDYQDIGLPSEEKAKGIIQEYQQKHPETKNYKVVLVEF